MIDENIEINDINNIGEIDSNQLNNYIVDKENEIKNILISKISTLEQKLEEYKKNNSEILTSLSNLKISNENNLRIIQERDNDLRSYEYKFNNLSNDIKEKDIEIINLKNKIEFMEIKLKQEKEEKSKDDEYSKYKINKQKKLYEEEIDSMKIVNGELNNDINKLKKKIEEIKEKNKNDIELFNGEKNRYEIKVYEL
jgi:chromosome segregation ATPase